MCSCAREGRSLYKVEELMQDNGYHHPGEGSLNAVGGKACERT